MSRESVQFVELVRQAASKITPPGLRLHYCEQCGCQRPHTIRAAGRDEIYTCRVRGYQKWYTVR